MVKNPLVNAGYVGSIPGSGRSPRVGNTNPLHYCCLGNPMDRGAWRATVQRVKKSQTWLNTQTISILPWYFSRLSTTDGVVQALNLEAFLFKVYPTHRGNWPETRGFLLPLPAGGTADAFAIGKTVSLYGPIFILLPPATYSCHHPRLSVVHSCPHPWVQNMSWSTLLSSSY